MSGTLIKWLRPVTLASELVTNQSVRVDLESTDDDEDDDADDRPPCDNSRVSESEDDGFRLVHSWLFMGGLYWHCMPLMRQA